MYGADEDRLGVVIARTENWVIIESDGDEIAIPYCEDVWLTNREY